jgi:hypothetical protein
MLSAYDLDLILQTPTVLTIKYDKALAHQTHRDDFKPVLDPVHVVCTAVVSRYGATARNTAKFSHPSKHKIQNLTADVVEVDGCVAVRAWEGFL